MNWKQLDDHTVLDLLISSSNDAPQLIFKHSTRCSISAMVLNRMRSYNSRVDCYLLDLVAYRSLSNAISDQFDVIHQSPQVLIIHRGKCIWDASHFEISIENVDAQLNKLGHLSG